MPPISTVSNRKEPKSMDVIQGVEYTYVLVVPSSLMDMSPLMPPQRLWPMTIMFCTCTREKMVLLGYTVLASSKLLMLSFMVFFGLMHGFLGTE